MQALAVSGGESRYQLIAFILALIICRSEVAAPWQVPTEERIRERFDPTCAAERRSKSRGTHAEGWIVIEGKSHSHLYLPSELVQDFLLRTDSSSVHTRQLLYERQIASAGWDYDLFWQVIDESGRDFRALWQSLAHDQRRSPDTVPADDPRRVKLCRARASALEAARNAFGRIEFDRFLYTTMPRQRVTAFDPKAHTPEALLHIENGCT